MVKPVLIGRSNRYGSVKPSVALRMRSPNWRLQAERLAQAQEVVGGVIEADEAAGDARDAALQADRVLAALLHLQRDVHGAGRACRA